MGSQPQPEDNQIGIIVKPSSFSPSTTISSSEVNADFDTVYNEFNGNISAANLASNSVTTAKIADSNVTTAKIADSNVTTAKIATDAVTAAKIDWASTGTDGGIWWEELGRTTLSGAADTISVTSIPARKYIKVMFYAINSGQISDQLRFNNDTGTNYSRRTSANGGADGTGTGSTATGTTSAVSTPAYYEYNIINVATQEKLIWGFRIDLGASGSGTAPGRIELGGKWSNTADQITRVDLVNGGTGDYASGSEVIVLGHN